MAVLQSGVRVDEQLRDGQVDLPQGLGLGGVEASAIVGVLVVPEEIHCALAPATQMDHLCVVVSLLPRRQHDHILLQGRPRGPVNALFCPERVQDVVAGGQHLKRLPGCVTFLRVRFPVNFVLAAIR